MPMTTPKVDCGRLGQRRQLQLKQQPWGLRRQRTLGRQGSLDADFFATTSEDFVEEEPPERGDTPTPHNSNIDNPSPLRLFQSGSASSASLVISNKISNFNFKTDGVSNLNFERDWVDPIQSSFEALFFEMASSTDPARVLEAVPSRRRGLWPGKTGPPCSKRRIAADQ